MFLPLPSLILFVIVLSSLATIESNVEGIIDIVDASVAGDGERGMLGIDTSHDNSNNTNKTYVLGSLGSDKGYSEVSERCHVYTCKIPTVNDPHLKVEVVSYGLFVPTTMAFLGANDILVLELGNGTVQRFINGTILPEPVLDVNVAGGGERGMLGIATSHDNSNNTNKTYVFLYFTQSKIDGGDPVGNSLYRYELVNNKLVNPKLLLDLPALPGPNHNGGAITIGPDDNIYLPIGDLDNVEDEEQPHNQAQNVLDGKSPDGSGGILRVTQDGKVVGKGILGNTYPLNLYYAYGIRNSFGIDFDPVTGNLWDTENGPNFGDEINLVGPGFNGGWLQVQGIWKNSRGNIGDLASNAPENLVDFGGKGKYSTPEFTWKVRLGPTAPKFFESNKFGTEYKNDLFVGNIHGNIYHFDLDKYRTKFVLHDQLKDKVADDDEELKDVTFAWGFGSITDLEVGPDGYLYVVSFGQGAMYRIVPR